ncbi:MAG: glycerol-3-phosphate dehydrogenase/oxidase [Desulfobacula sp.]|nr:glycerol-3-phosphate dehydrogenase/oxidase [Desulfobacula sp.]
MLFSDIQGEYDMVVAGGGITGAGVFHGAVKRGFKVLLAEARDFAWGTSSRSSKMVHGGLRYLKQGRLLLTRAAVQEREFLLRQYPGLVTPMGFIMPLFRHYGPSRAAMAAGLSIYSLLAGERQHRYFTQKEALDMIPGLRKENLLSAVGFKDAQVDDARLVLRLIYDACQNGGDAVNYARVTGVERDARGRVAAVLIRDEDSGAALEIKTPVLINAGGALAETLHPSPMKGFHIRPLRGSHLFFPSNPLSLDRVISFMHPQDQRPVFLFPWEGVLVLGTTDVDHGGDVNAEPRISKEEAHYLMEGMNHVLPGLNLNLSHCISSMAGIRPVLSRGKSLAASKESREHVVWQDKGLVTVTGGKLTTFRLLAHDALKAAKPFLPVRTPGSAIPEDRPPLNRISSLKVPGRTVERILGRYGPKAGSMILDQEESLLAPVENTPDIWAEIRHAAQHEDIHHLPDLMLRRVRIGLLLPNGGVALLDRVESLCSPFLSWDKARWEKEKKDYANLWQACYSPPEPLKEP